MPHIRPYHKSLHALNACMLACVHGCILSKNASRHLSHYATLEGIKATKPLKKQNEMEKHPEGGRGLDADQGVVLEPIP